MDRTAKEITRLLEEVGRGERSALDELWPVVYDELRRLARSLLRGERADHTLQPTALVHEAWVRLIGSEPVTWENRRQFFGVAASAMRRVLVDHARRRLADKRGGGAVKLSLSHADRVAAGTDPDVLALDDALNRLSQIDPDKSRLVELRFFAGLTVEETARVLGQSMRTVERDWTFAKTWLARELRGPAGA